ncbi:MAG: hypothetical protein IJI92_03570 [Erysipelotrichaceae bacterium]|nr:hypothetical protein [Erysipelotrichaceae bacterium]
MPALPESIFDVCYLVFAIISGIVLIRKAEGRKDIRLMGIATLLLGCGDAFHLIPRVLNYWLAGDYTAALGIGKLITSLTMTVFYVLLEQIRINRYHDDQKQSYTYLIWILSVIRIALCFFPQNAWTSAEAPVSWGIYRNIPFTLIGILTVYLWYKDAKEDEIFRYLYLAVLLSFAFYLIVVLLAHKVPLMGMFMLPKTIMYIWIILMFRKAESR